MIRLIALVLAILVSGCVPEVTAEKLATIKTIGVVLAVGDNVTLKRVGVTVFGNAEKTFYRPQWGLKRDLFMRIKSQLGNRFDVREAMMPLDDHAAPSKIRTAFAEVRPPGLDAYLVVTTISILFDGTNQPYRGAGLLRISGISSFKVSAYENLSFGLYDGRSLERLSFAGSSELTDVASDVWVDSLDGASEAQVRRVREVLLSLPNENLIRAFRRMHLE